MAYCILALKPAGVAAPYVIGDLAEALSDLGHTVHVLELQELAGQSPEAVKSLVISIAPDFAIMYGVSGLFPVQQGPRVGTFLTELDIPYACLICDNPELMLNELKWAKSDLMHLFVWDQVYVEELKKLGFEKVFPFALATNPRRFKLQTPLGEENFRVPVAFVGSLPTLASIEMLKKEIAADALVDIVLDLKRTNPEWSCRQCIANLMKHLGAEAAEELNVFMDSPAFGRFNRIIDGHLMYEQRLQIIRLLELEGISVWGNDAWANALREATTYRGRINYETEVPLLYQSAGIIIDIPAGQLLTSVKLRSGK